MIFGNYYQHLKYTLIHKGYVAVECWKRGLYWRGIVHDWQKFTPSEFSAYANNFFTPDGTRIQRSNKMGFYAPNEEGITFMTAWRHHWQNWVDIRDYDETGSIMETYVTPMSADARLEMICDWIGASKAQGTDNPVDWYKKNATKLRLHHETRKWVEEYLKTL